MEIAEQRIAIVAVGQSGKWNAHTGELRLWFAQPLFQPLLCPDETLLPQAGRIRKTGDARHAATDDPVEARAGPD